MATLSLRNVYKAYGAFEALSEINLEIRSGESIVFVGPSGCGKSTLLRCISGLETITSGTLAIEGDVVNDVPAANRGIAMVFQSYALYPHMTVYENIAYSLMLQRIGKAVIRRKVEEVAQKLQLTSLLDRRPRALSGGQRQRVAIGRAIVRDPLVFLFDEPLSNLDAALRVQTRLEIARLKASLPSTTMIYVTHDQVEAMTLADRIVVLNHGRVEQVGTPMELYESPASLFVAGFIGSPRMNLLGGAFAASHDAHTVGIRPEHLAVDPNGDWAGQVIYSENLGSDSFTYLDVAMDDPVILRQAGKSEHASGTNLRFSAIGRCHRFDAEGRPMSS